MPGHRTVPRRCGYAGACQFPGVCAGFANFSRWAGMVKPGSAAARGEDTNIEHRTLNIEHRTEEEESEARGIFSLVRRWTFGVGRSMFGFWRGDQRRRPWNRLLGLVICRPFPALLSQLHRAEWSSLATGHLRDGRGSCAGMSHDGEFRQWLESPSLSLGGLNMR